MSYQNTRTLVCPRWWMLAALFIAVLSAATAQDTPLAFDVENRGAGCSVTPGGTTVSTTKLPDPFEWADGSGRVGSFEEWSCRRSEIKAEIEKYEIGPKPEPPQVTANYSNGKLNITVSDNGSTLNMSSTFSVPSGAGPHPIVIGVNAPTGQLDASLFPGVVHVEFTTDQVATYAMGAKDLNAPFYQMYPNLTYVGDMCAWAWGVSRLIDGLEIVADQLNLDMGRIAMTGCSYAGKIALFSGAFDDRIALTIAQESGGGGIPAWRLSQQYEQRSGNEVEDIGATTGAWFMASSKQLNPNTLPHDHHELIAMIAPRAFIALGNPYQEWLSDEAGYKSVMAAREVWKAMGVEDRIGFDFDDGHNHCSASSRQNQSAKIFIDKFLLNKNTDTESVMYEPVRPEYDLDYATSIDWSTPEIKYNSNGPKVTVSSETPPIIDLGESVILTATVDDPNNDLVDVKIYAGDELLETFTSAPYSITWTSSAIGSTALSVKATDAEGNVGSGKVSLTVVTPQTPYGGIPHAIPGKIEFEAFDEGGQLSAYYDIDEGTNVDPAPPYRTGEDVDIEECDDTGGGYNLGWTSAGEWLEYTVNVEATGTYDMSLRTAVKGTGRTVDFSFDNEPLASGIVIPDTKDWQTWQTVTVNDVALTAGEHIMRLTIGAENYINMNYIEFTPVNIQDNSIELTEGWNMIGFPHSQSKAIAAALESIWPYVESVKDEQNIYNKDYPDFINLLKQLDWSGGYLVKVSANCSLEW